MDAIRPGPFSRTVIFDNEYHVSEDVWVGEDRGTLECYCGNRLMRQWMLSDAQKQLLHEIGFGLFVNNDVVLQNDTALITALVERWRPETNTFFMRQGEMTVTLEDVGFILGLPILGRPLVGPGVDNPRCYFARHWIEELTEAQVEEAWGRAGIKYTWLHKMYGGLPGDDVERIAIHTQAYLINYDIFLTRDCLAYAKVKPAVNQIETHPYFQRDSLVKFCQKHGVCVTAHTPLGGAVANAEWFGTVSCLDDPILKGLTEKYKKTAAQIVLRWGIQRNTVVIPKSSKLERLKENFEVFDFELNEEEMNIIKTMERDYRTNQPAKFWGINLYA